MTRPVSVFAACSLLIFGRALVAQTPTTKAPIDCSWLTVDTVTKTATFELIAGLTGLNGGLNFNGFNDGKLTLTVPRNWNVVVRFSNRDVNLPHSAEVIDSQKPTPAGPVDPAFARAMTTRLTQGMDSTQTDEFRFVASQAGSFWIFCAVPGHGLAGMWIKLQVSPTETRPKLVATTT
jgi:sulfocyanin